MKYLGLLFHAPMQSWGAESLPDVNAGSPRNTQLLPTKSAVLGFLNSASGVSRGQEPPYSSSDIRILTRSDRPGTLMRDYNVAQRTHHGYRAGTTKVIPKYYLQDATFTVLIGHEDVEIINQFHEAVNNPKWAPFIGRRAHVLSLPPTLGMIEAENPRQILEKTPVMWSKNEATTKTVLYTDSQIGKNDMVTAQTDEQLSHNIKDRAYGKREFAQYSVQVEVTNEYRNLPTIQQYQEMVAAYVNQ